MPTATLSPSAVPETVPGQTVHVAGESLVLKVTLENRTEMCFVIAVPPPMVTDPDVDKLPELVTFPLFATLKTSVPLFWPLKTLPPLVALKTPAVPADNVTPDIATPL